MKAQLCHGPGKPEDLVYGDVPEPELHDTGIRIRVRATGINFADSLLLSGKYQIKPGLPFSPGLEVAGDILECGAGVKGFSVGQRVLAIVDYGGFAEQVVARADSVYVLPDSLDYTLAAAVPVAYGTSHLGLKEMAGLKAGETLLVHGAAGGVGLTAVEIGKHMGAKVIATAGGSEKLKIAESYGADLGIDYRSEDIAVRVKELTDGHGADVIYDPVGGAVFDASLKAVTKGGRILVVGFASGTVPQIPANILLVKNVTVIGYYWGGWHLLDAELFRASMIEVLAWIGEDLLKPHVSHTYPLQQAPEALNLLLNRKSTGKVVLTID